MRAPNSARNRTSQHGEDGIIGRIFSLFPQCATRFCVDVGAWDGKHLSNTHSLLCSSDGPSTRWTGVLIEADRERFDELRALHGPLGNVCVCEEVSCEANSNRSLSRILQRNSPALPMDLDFVSIDVDGTDYWLLHDLFEAGYRPKVVCIEFNPTMPVGVLVLHTLHTPLAPLLH